MLRNLIPWLVIVCCLAPLAGKADPAPSDSFALTRVALDDDYWPIAVGTDDTLYAYKPGQPRLYRSTNKGATWTIVYTNNTTPYQSRPLDLFVTKHGWVLWPTNNTGQVVILKHQGTGTGMLVPADTLNFTCNTTTPKATMWHPVEDATADKVYIGEYGGGFTDVCAYIWCGTWNGTGYDWALSNDAGDEGGMSGRHVHGMGIDPTTRWLYAMFGDRGASYTNPESDGYLMRKTLAGDWEARPQAKPSGWESQWLTIGFGGGRRILATDRGGPTETNFFAWTADDSTYTIADSLTAPILPWSFGKGADGTQYVSTVNQSTAGARNQILISRDAGASWKAVYEADLLSTTYAGFVGLTTKALSTGEMFYWWDAPGTANDATYRFTLDNAINKTNWLIGSGVDCDFSTVAAALSNVLVGAGDTLTLKANQTHSVTVTPKADITIMGQGNDRDAVIVRPGAANYAVFTCSNGGVRIANLTIRPYLSGGVPQTHSNYIIGLSVGDITKNIYVENVRIAGFTLNAGTTGLIDAPLAIGYGGQVRLIGCAVDSCSSASGATARIVSLVNVTRVVVDDCEFNLNTSGIAPIYYAATSAVLGNWSLIVRNSLFNQNTTSGTSGGAVHWSHGNGTTDTTLFQNNTFYMNVPAAAASGQVYWASDVAKLGDAIVTHSIFVGDGDVYATNKVATADNRPVATWCDTYSSGVSNHLWAQSQDDTLQVDPEFVTTALDSTRKFMPRNCTEVDGSSVCVTDDASYMGYIEPYGTAAAPALLSPATGYPSPLTTMVVDWSSYAHADSFAVRWGTACAAGTYATTDSTSTDTLAVTPNTTYYWQVRAKDCIGWGPWSGCWTFGKALESRRDDGFRGWRLRGR